MAVTVFFIIELQVPKRDSLVFIHSFTEKLFIEHILCTTHNPSVPGVQQWDSADEDPAW